jgi:membrane protein DedA with SNARE-associated domain
MKRKLTTREVLITTLSLAATIALCVIIVCHRDYLAQIEQYGYLGCFVLNVLSGATVVAPGLSILVTFTLAGVLTPSIVGALAGAGEAIGAVTPYLIGYGGHNLLRDNNKRAYVRFSNALHRHGSKVVFFMASVFNPVYYPFAVFLGMLHFGLLKFFLLTWVGRTIKDMSVAYLGYFGLRFVLQWLGIPI